MLQYSIQTVLFQLIFLVAYDLFHKKDTFFTVNRVYLLASSALSLVLPLIKVKSIQETIPDNYVVNLPTVFIGENPINTQTIQIVDIASSGSLDINWWILIYSLSTFIAMLFFIRKILTIQSLKKNAIKDTINGYSLRILLDSTDAFTFWNTIYLGDQLSDEEKEQILIHEMVHLKQKHTLDLIWFETIKIFFWFNPMAYIYYSRVITLHEYISDASAIKLLGKREYYERLLNANFQTKNVKFTNNFFNHRLLKKRITMLQKKKSKANAKLKYLAIIPLLILMLTFTAFSQKAASITTISSQKITDEIVELTNSFSNKKGADKIPEKTTSVVNFNSDKSKIKESISSEKEDELVEASEQKINEKIIRDTLSVKDKEIVHKLLEIKADIINNSKSFASRAVLYSEDPGSKANGGYYLVKKDTPFPENFKNIAFSTKKGEISEPFKTSFGWHILTVDNIEVDAVGIRHILLLSKTEDVPFAIVDKVPSTKRCNNLTEQAEIKKCVSDEIKQFVSKNFNTKIAEQIGLTGTNRIYVRFKIDTTGKIVDVQSRGPVIELEEEAVRVVQSLPQMIPGEAGGEKVSVLYSLPIVFSVAPSNNNNIQQRVIQQDNRKKDTVLTEKLSDIENHNVKKGYYLITNIFKNQHYFERGIAQLKKQGLQPKFFVNPKDTYTYVYLEKYDTLEEAKKMLFSDFNGQYKEDLYILKIQ